MKAVEIARRLPDDASAEIDLYLNPDLFWFRGHFAVQALLPGVAQLEWAMHYATELLAPGHHFHSISNVKYQMPLLPKDRVTLELAWHEARQILTFSYWRTNANERRQASSGKVRLCR